MVVSRATNITKNKQQLVKVLRTFSGSYQVNVIDIPEKRIASIIRYWAQHLDCATAEQEDWYWLVFDLQLFRGSSEFSDGTGVHCCPYCHNASFEQVTAGVNIIWNAKF